MVDCEFFEIIDWDESTNEVIHAVCTMPSPTWPNCNRCKDRMEYSDVEEDASGNTIRMVRWVLGKQHTLTQGDIDVLDGSRSRKVRIDVMEDVEIKNLYDMWKQL
jgi:hypothetical protein